MCRCLLASRSRVHVCNTLIRYPVFDIISMMRLSAAFFIQCHGFLLQIWWKGHRLESLPPLPLPWRIKRRKKRRTIISVSILISVSFFFNYGFNTLLPPSPVMGRWQCWIILSYLSYQGGRGHLKEETQGAFFSMSSSLVVVVDLVDLVCTYSYILKTFSIGFETFVRN